MPIGSKKTPFKKPGEISSYPKGERWIKDQTKLAITMHHEIFFMNLCKKEINNALKNNSSLTAALNDKNAGTTHDNRDEGKLEKKL